MHGCDGALALILAARSARPFAGAGVAIAGLVAGAVAVFSAGAPADVKIVLKDDFIKKYMHRATIDTCLHVDAVGRANFIDGDMHIAGRSHDVQLPIVAEIMNARRVPEAVDFLKNAEGEQCVPVAGVWRLWCEHGRNDVFVQGEPVEPSPYDNPNHAFEIHPVTRVGERLLPETFRPIPAIASRDARRAFPVYETTPCKIRHSATAQVTSIESPIVWRNYPEFIMQILDEPPMEVEDGMFLYASVLDLDGELMLSRRRMVFVKDTPPEAVVRRHNPGDRIHVLGLTRISLALIDWRVQGAAQNPELLDAKLPYELVIVAIYPE